MTVITSPTKFNPVLFIFEFVVKKRLPRHFAGLLSAPLKPMDNGTFTKTSRKGFFKRTGVAIAAAFAFGGSANAESTLKKTATAGRNASGGLRARPAKGAVARKSIDLA